jgi:hypothetical protein
LGAPLHTHASRTHAHINIRTGTYPHALTGTLRAGLSARFSGKRKDVEPKPVRDFVLGFRVSSLSRGESNAALFGSLEADLFNTGAIHTLLTYPLFKGMAWIRQQKKKKKKNKKEEETKRKPSPALRILHIPLALFKTHSGTTLRVTFISFTSFP